MPWFDTHAHLTDEQLQPTIETVLASASATGVVGIATIGTTAESSREGVALANRFPQVVASVGIHPNYCHTATEADWAAIEALAQLPRVVAIGETGLDRYWDYCPIEIQRQWFARHIELSFATQKPLVIHVRDCEPDVLAMLADHQRDGRIIGIMHSFAGSWETAQRCLALGMYISFSGIVTYKKSEQLREVAAQVPADRLLIETDAPYLSPHPHRNIRPNQPSLVRHTAECLADVRDISSMELGELTTKNAETVFRLEFLKS